MATYMSISDAAKYLEVSEITVKRFVREKLIASEQQDGVAVLDEEAVKKYKALAEQFSGR